MGMFDYYKPKEETRCSVCGKLLIEWQGKDGPCALFVWQEGITGPIDQLVDDELKWPPEELSKFRLPDQFVIYSYDCPEHAPIEASCYCHDGIWDETVLLPFKGKGRFQPTK